MKKKLLLLLGMLLISSTINFAQAKSVSNSELSEAIKLYKLGNYAESYVKLDSVLKQDTSNALAYYYKAMSATQLGRKDEAIDNYAKAMSLSPDKNNLYRYAKKGKNCLENPDKCTSSMYSSAVEEFIQSKKGPKFSEEVRSDYERLKIENLMREINRSKEIDPQTFKEYKDFSNIPTNDEIVAALRTLQRAGFGNLVNNGFSDLSILTGNNSQGQLFNFMGQSGLSPQLIQTMLTNNITQGF